MIRASTQRLVAMHAIAMADHVRLTRAADRETDHNRRHQLRDDAAECRANADALADLLRESAPEVEQPPAGQLALVGLGLGATHSNHGEVQ
jgi:hypothetical protein